MGPILIPMSNADKTSRQALATSRIEKRLEGIGRPYSSAQAARAAIDTAYEADRITRREADYLSRICRLAFGD